MSGYDDLRGLSGDLVRAPDEFAVSDEVWQAVERVPLVLSAWLCCVQCRQGVAHVEWNGKQYVHSDEELHSLTLAHMIQRHGWTRETPSVD